jgi:hypothetical protein
MFAMVRRSSLWENLPFQVTSRGVTVPVAAQIVSASCARCEYGRALYSILRSTICPTPVCSATLTPTLGHRSPKFCGRRDVTVQGT